MPDQTEPVNERGRLRLVINDNKSKLSSATVPIRWGVTKENDRIFLEEHPEACIIFEFTEPYEDPERVVIPLSEAMDYFVIQHPGKTRVRAVIVFQKKEYDSYEAVIQAIKSYYLKRSNYAYENTIVWPTESEAESIDKESSRVDIGTSVYESLGFFEAILDIPKECFAPEPPKWLKRWGNLWFSHKPVDQCAFRKRLFFAFTLKPILFCIYWFFLIIAKLILGIFGLLFFIRANYGYLIPRTYWDLDKFSESSDDSYFVKEKDDGSYRWWTISFTPAFIVVSYLIVISTTKWLIYTQFWSILLMELLLVVCCFGINLFTNSLGKYRKYLRKKSSEKDRNKVKPEAKFDTSFLALKGKARARYEELPGDKRTLTLRFWSIKANVCKPYAKN